MNEEFVILVDEQDRELGRMEKLEAHRQARLHRAFSVFVFNARGEMLLQRRALDKYHSPGLWTNTCCSHPRPGEATLQAAQRRLQEEMGLQVPLAFKTAFVYKAAFDNALTEYEYDHIFVGHWETDPQINPQEVAEFRWEQPSAIKAAIRLHPENYTEWFKIAMETVF